jgi:predicted NBD/HSP70 family sugar kinase
MEMAESKVLYLQKVKNQNVSHILHKIWEHEAVSRIELVQMTHLTSGTITNLTQELISHRLIKESESISDSVGRKRVNLRFDNSYFYIIGIDIGRTSVSVVLSELTGNIVDTVEYGTEGITNPEEVLALIEPYVHKLLGQAESRKRKVIGIGVSIPGPMDQRTGKLINPPGFPGWAGYPIRPTLEERFKTRVFIEDDARTSALAERWYGIGRDGRDLVFVTMGMGIGGGIVQNGRVLHGTNGLYGQIGQMSLMTHGGAGNAISFDCWENLGSIPGILKRWSGNGDFRDFIVQVRAQEPHAVKVMEDTLRMLEASLTSLINLYDPDVIVLGGKLYPYLSPHMEAIVENVRSRVFDFVQERVIIEKAFYGQMQSLMGAVALVFGHVQENPLLVLGAD